MPFAGLPPVAMAPQTERGTVMDRSFVSLQVLAVGNKKQVQAGSGMRGFHKQTWRCAVL